MFSQLSRVASRSTRYFSTSPLLLQQASRVANRSLTQLDSPPENTEFIGMTGGQIIHELLRRNGVKKLFGYSGGAIMPLFDALHDSPFMDFYLPRHEQGGGHMAQGYSRVSGQPGVVVVTSGPGATNLMTAMQDALSDGTPMIVFTGQVPTTAIGTDAFQEANIIGISRFCTKWNVMVKSVSELPRKINEAFYIATSGRPGPVLVDLPKDVTAGVLHGPIDPSPDLPILRKRQAERVPNNDEVIATIAKLLNNASKPIIYAGHGVITSGASSLLTELATKGNIPVTTTLLGLGAFDEYSPLSLHMLGMHGSAYANFAMQNADLIIALGARFDDRVTGTLSKFAPVAKQAAVTGKGGIVHFDILPKNINKVVEVNHAVLGDVAQNLAKLVPLVEFQERKPWFREINTWKEKYPLTYPKPKPGELLKPQQVIEELDRQTANIKNNVIITTGVGQHQMWAAQFYRWTTPNSCITSGGLGTMGFGLPAAIGAKIARPDKIVIDIDGDASFAMTGMEFMTACEFKIGVKVLIINNSFQGMIKQWQDLFYHHRYSAAKMTNPDFIKLAESMGGKGLRLRTEEELPRVMAEFLAHDGPIILDAVVSDDQHVFPMVPAGKGLDEMVFGD